MKPHILIIEAEEKLAKFVKLELEDEAYEVSVAYDGLSGIATARELTPDLILLDWMLLDSGLEICHRLRQTGELVPIIMLATPEDLNSDRFTLDADADDYLVKPFSIEELLARVKGNLRQEQDAFVLKVADLTLNLFTREVYRQKRLIELTSPEFDLLKYLISHPRQILTREQILARVWGVDFMGDSQILEVCIGYLRSKLELNQEFPLIKTVSAIGYILKE
jgi:DNA-binding response OmpR family regulator